MSQGQRDRLSVFVASTLIDPVRDELREAFDVTFAGGEGSDPLSELSTRAEKGEAFDAVLLSLDLPLGSEAIRTLPDSVGAVATYSVGTDHIDLEAAEERDLVVLNTPGVLADSVAENAIFLMLGAARRGRESIDLLRSGNWQGWNPTQLVGRQLSGRTLGILGMGDIGERIALRASALGMAVLYCNRRKRSQELSFPVSYRETVTELIAESDVLLLACPSTPETRGIVNDALLAEAKRDLILVNIARGDLVIDEALISALRGGGVWAAGLDVFDGEPNIDPRYFDLPNVFMLPHIGSSTMEARLGMGRILIEGLTAWQAGAEIANRVRPGSARKP